MKKSNLSNINNPYISAVAEKIKNKNSKKLISEELYSHILDKADYYQEIGYTREEAIDKATKEMGNPDEVALSFNSLHYSSWYENPLNLDAVILLIIQIILLFFFSDKLKYNEYETIHYVYKDFISLFLLGFNLFVIHRAREEKNNLVLIGESISLIFQGFYNPYQPALYGIVTTFLDKNPSNYFDYIFSYRFIPPYTFDILNTASYILIGLMLCFCIISVVCIFLNKKGFFCKNIWKVSKLIGITTMILTYGNLIFMSVSTLSAVTQYDIKATENNKTNRALVEYLLDIEEKGTSVEQVKKDLSTKNIFQKYDIPEDIHNELIVDYQDKKIWSYSVNSYRLFDMDINVLGEPLYNDCSKWIYYIANTKIELSDFEYDKYVSISNLTNKRKLKCNTDEFKFVKKGLPLEKFIKSDLFSKISNITYINNYSTPKKKRTALRFEFITEHWRTKTLTFRKNKLVNISDETPNLYPYYHPNLYPYYHEEIVYY